eukprot:symbB.v1.2.022240.t1/scaffold1951.1/size99721/10
MEEETLGRFLQKIAKALNCEPAAVERYRGLVEGWLQMRVLHVKSRKAKARRQKNHTKARKERRQRLKESRRPEDVRKRELQLEKDRQRKRAAYAKQKAELEEYKAALKDSAEGLQILDKTLSKQDQALVACVDRATAKKKLREAFPEMRKPPQLPLNETSAPAEADSPAEPRSENQNRSPAPEEWPESPTTDEEAARQKNMRAR